MNKSLSKVEYNIIKEDEIRRIDEILADSKHKSLDYKDIIQYYSDYDWNKLTCEKFKIIYNRDHSISSYGGFGTINGSKLPTSQSSYGAKNSLNKMDFKPILRERLRCTIDYLEKMDDLNKANNLKKQNNGHCGIVITISNKLLPLVFKNSNIAIMAKQQITAYISGENDNLNEIDTLLIKSSMTEKCIQSAIEQIKKERKSNIPDLIDME